MEITDVNRLTGFV